MTVPPGDGIPAYLDEYRERIARLGSDPGRSASEYSVALRVVPTPLRCW